MRWIGISLASSSALSACTRLPMEKIIPYISNTEGAVPGDPLIFATSLALQGYARGVWVKSYEGRPTKIEGNPLHPASLGASDIFMQAELLSLYDPDRLKSVLCLGSTSDWSSFRGELEAKKQEWKNTGGQGLRILTETVTSPSIGDQIAKILKLYPKAKWHAYEPINSDLLRAAARMAFGEDLRPVYRIENAKTVVSLDSDFLGAGPAQIPQARAFSLSRKGDGSSQDPCRLQVIESTVSITGGTADTRHAVKPSQIHAVALELFQKLRSPGPSVEFPWIQGLAEELHRNHGTSLVIAGEHLPAETQALALAMNSVLGNIGKTLDLIAGVEIGPSNQTQSLTELTHDMDQGVVDSLFTLGGNPGYSAPSDLGFLEKSRRVPFLVHKTLEANETSEHCRWVLPAAHALESWGDHRAFDGTLTFQQPLIDPLYLGKTPVELLAMISGDSAKSARKILGDYWSTKSLKTSELFDGALHDGMIKGSASISQSVRLRDFAKNLKPSAGIEIRIIPDPTIGDGRFANNGWLQELPKPITQLTWDNAALISPSMAKELNLSTGDEIEIKVASRVVLAPVFILPGHPDGAASLQLGYGREKVGSIGKGRGYNAYNLRTTDHPYLMDHATLIKTGKKIELACTQSHHQMEGRDPIKRGTFRQPPLGDLGRTVPSLLVPFENPAEAWAMVIDLSACIGCKVCMIACQAENNIPVVGKEEVLRHREMHWIRVDRYFAGTAENPEIFHQPVPCMHCETAPCELVCPTAATNHSTDGLNQMVYNRCVGTRYCSNNCPYKVRRFNFFEYAKAETPLAKKMQNPEVTVRSRGVMEKCSYCVQRIQAGRIGAQLQNRKIKDGEVVTACQAACPTQAITFGDQNDLSSRVSKLKQSRLGYALLGELGTKPRTTYLPALRSSP